MTLRLQSTEHPTRRRAAALVYRRTRGFVEYLLVTAKRDDSRFVLPAGGIEEGERAAETAWRETVEEAGAIIEIQSLLGQYDHRKRDGGDHPTQVFLARFRGNTPPSESRIRRWVSHHEVVNGGLSVDDAIVSMIDQAECLMTAAAAA